jgi:hypothetical protein
MNYVEISLYWAVGRVVGWFVTGISGQHIIFVFNSQDVQKASFLFRHLSRNVHDKPTDDA